MPGLHCLAPPRSLHFKIHFLLKDASTSRGVSQGRWGRKRNQISGLKEDKDPADLPRINDLTASSLHSSSLRGDPFFPLVHLCLASALTETVSPCALSCYCAMSLIINFVPAFTGSASVINATIREK